MNTKIISVCLVFIMLFASFSLNSFATDGAAYSITVDGTTFNSDESKSGNGWSYADGTLTLDNYSGSSIFSAGDLTLIAKNSVAIKGTSSDVYSTDSCGLVVTGTLILDVSGDMIIVGANNNGVRGGEAIVASKAMLESSYSAKLGLCGGLGAPAIKANELVLETKDATIKGGVGSSAIYFSTNFTVKGSTNAVIQAGSEDTYAITYLSGASYSFDEEEQIVEFYDGSSKIVIVAKNNFIPGDCNSDGKVDTKDAVLLAQFLAKWSVTINELASDCRRDGIVDTKDAVLLAQFLAKWDVTLG